MESGEVKYSEHMNLTHLPHHALVVMEVTYMMRCSLALFGSNGRRSGVHMGRPKYA